MDAREEQSLKQYPSKLVTEDGILMDAREEHPEKQNSPKLVTEDGILMDVREEQNPHLEVTDYQLFAVNTIEKRIGLHL